METAELTVDPGSQITTTVTVRNLGTRVEEFQLILQGPGAAFASITPDTLSVYPDLEQRAVVRFAPLRAPQSTAGVTTFEVVARSAVHSDVRDVVRGRLTITPFQDLKAVLTPDVSRGRKPGRHLVSVTNGGNTPVHAQLAFKDQDGVLTFEPQQGTATLEPGDKADLPTLINGPRRWFGRTERLAFSALITPPEPHPPITLNGTRQQSPIFPWWMPTAAIAILALAIGLAALLKPGQATVPVVGQLDEPQAVELLKEARYLPESVPQKDNDVPQGKAIGTEPQGGAELKPGERVKLFVSSGPEEGGPSAPIAPVPPGPAQGDQPKPDEAKGGEEKPAGEAKPGEAKPAGEAKPDEVKPGEKPGEPKPGEEKPGEPKPEAKQIEIPPLKGQPSGKATETLEDLGMKVKSVPVHSNAVADGNVLSTKPDANSKVDPGSEVTLTVAENTVPVNLLEADAAAKAKWESNAGPIDFGKEDVIPSVSVHSVGQDDIPTKQLEVFLNKGNFITGVYKLEKPVVAGDHVRAKIGLLEGTTGKVTFIVKAKDTVIQQTLQPGSSASQLEDFDADLSAAEGATSIEITTTTVLTDATSTEASATPDGGVWQNLRFEP